MLESIYVEVFNKIGLRDETADDEEEASISFVISTSARAISNSKFSTMLIGSVSIMSVMSRRARREGEGLGLCSF